MNEQTIKLKRVESSILVDALKWYLDEEENLENDTIEMIEKSVEELNKNNTITISKDDGILIKTEILKHYTYELKPYLQSMENTGKNMRFYENNVKNISEEFQRRGM